VKRKNKIVLESFARALQRSQTLGKKPGTASGGSEKGKNRTRKGMSLLTVWVERLRTLSPGVNKRATKTRKETTGVEKKEEKMRSSGVRKRGCVTLQRSRRMG